MAKSQPINRRNTLVYNGYYYECVYPKELIYNNRLYVIAADIGEKDILKEMGLAPTTEDPGLGMPEAWEPPAPPEQPAGGVDPGLVQELKDEAKLTEEEKVERTNKNLTELEEALVKSIEKVLRDTDVKYKAIDAIEAIDKLGIDSKVDITTGNFNKFPDTSLIFDYKVNLKGGEGESFKELLSRKIRQVRDGASTFQELTLNFCRHNFVGSTEANTLALLRSISIMQNKALVRAGELMEVPIERLEQLEDKGEHWGKAVKWMTKIMEQILVHKVAYGVKEVPHARSRNKWQKKETLAAVLAGMVRNKIIADAQFQIAKAVLEKMSDEDYLKMLKDALDPTSEDTTDKAVSRDRIQEEIKKLTAHEGYDSTKFRAGINDKGNIDVSISSPYKFVYEFSIKGARLQLEEAGFHICNYAFYTKSDEKMAAALLSASLDLAQAFGRTPNESLDEEQERKDRKRLLDQILTDREEMAKELLGAGEGEPKEKPVDVQQEIMTTEGPAKVTYVQ